MRNSYPPSLSRALIQVLRGVKRKASGGVTALVSATLGAGCMCAAEGAETVPVGGSQQPAAAQSSERPVYIREYRVQGAKELPRINVEEAVYPYLGPGRTAADVEAARAALEELYREKGFQAVSVVVPPQPRSSVVILQVFEGRVGKLRVKGSRFFDLEQIKKRAPSLREGTIVNFNNVNRDILALNTWPDRRVTPSLRAGEEPGTVDIDLTVEDTFPLHGSLELNNRYSASTTPLRLTGALSYNNLWQLGHSIGGNFQISPQALDEVQIISGFYTARFPTVDWLTLTLQATKQESNVSSIGGISVVAPGETVGIRAGIVLPPGKDFYHSLTLGFDYKRFDQDIAGETLDELIDQKSITYFPFSIFYGASWVGKSYTTEFNAGLTFAFRYLGSDDAEFINNRAETSGSFLTLRGDLSHTHDLPLGAEIFGKVQGQLASGALIPSEQFAGGGLGTVRGYLEAEVLGDNAIIGTLELRSPSLLGWMRGKGHEWRVYAFIDAGLLTARDALPEEQSRFELASFGIGSRMQLFEYLNGSVDVALPMFDQGETDSYDPFVSFRVWAEF